MRRSSFRARRTRIVLSTIALLSLATLGHAQTYTWNAGVGSFDTPSNWTPAGTPEIFDDVIVNNGGTVNYTTGDTWLNSITLGSTPGTSGAFVMTGGSINLNLGGLRVGEQGTGTFTVNDAAFGTGDGSIFVGGQNNGGTGVLNLSGPNGRLSSTDDFVLGRVGTGTFNMTGGYATADYTVIGKFGTGVWNQSGGLFEQTSGDFEIGDGGTPGQASTPGPRSGTMNLTGGVVQGSGFFAISNRRGNGFANISGGALAMTGVVNNGAIIVGRGMDWGGQPGTGGVTELRVSGDDSIIIANGDFEMNLNDVALSSTLVAEITGPTHTTIKVTGSAKIANGALKVELSGYTPVAGDSWTILSAGVEDLAAEKNAINAMLPVGEEPLVHAAPAAVGTLQGEFKATNFAPLSAGLSWDLDYVNNSVVLSVVGSGPTYTADFNDDGRVDGLDLAAWKTAYGQGAGADANGDQVSDGADFLEWQRQFGSGVPAAAAAGAIPEPASLALIGVAAAAMAVRMRTARD
jgi:hypothetical protein